MKKSELITLVENTIKKILKEDRHISPKVNESGKCPASGCTKKVGSNWRVISNKTGKLWPQHYKTDQEAKDAISAYHVHEEVIIENETNEEYKKGDLVYNKDAGMHGLVGLVISDKYNEDGFNYDVIYRGMSGVLIQEKERDLISIIPDYLELADKNGDIMHYANIAKGKGIKLNPIYQETIDNNLELDEISTSAGAGAYMTPNAFSSKTDDKIANMNGYKKVKVKDLEEMIEQAIRNMLVKESKIKLNEYVSNDELKLMRPYKRLADSTIKKVQDRIKLKGAYEDAGQNEIRKFMDKVGNSDLSYNAQAELQDYINELVDNLEYK
jgi:hypothetical protein